MSESRPTLCPGNRHIAMSDKDYKIRFAGKEIPAFEVWSKLGLANEALDVLARFNTLRDALATDFTRSTEKAVRQRLSSIELMLPAPPKKDQDMQEVARALLSSHTPEEALDILRREHNVDADMDGLIHLAGREAYVQSMAAEAGTFRQNAISFHQIPDLWSDAKRPAPGKPFWDKAAVEALLKGQGTAD